MQDRPNSASTEAPPPHILLLGLTDEGLVVDAIALGSLLLVLVLIDGPNATIHGELHRIVRELLQLVVERLGVVLTLLDERINVLLRDVPSLYRQVSLFRNCGFVASSCDYSGHC